MLILVFSVLQEIWRGTFYKKFPMGAAVPLMRVHAELRTFGRGLPWGFQRLRHGLLEEQLPPAQQLGKLLRRREGVVDVVVPVYVEERGAYCGAFAGRPPGLRQRPRRYAGGYCIASDGPRMRMRLCVGPAEGVEEASLKSSLGSGLPGLYDAHG